MAILVQLNQFEGPLDLLLHLIGSAKIDIKDIFVSEVTDQYIQIVQESQVMDMDEASEFITMAATLLLIKSRSMLPPPQEPEEEEAPEDVLIRQLEEYARFKQIAQQMTGYETLAGKMYTKLPEEFPLPPPSFELEGLTLEGLVAAFAKVYARALPEQETVSTGGRMIRREQFTVPGCMAGILRRIKKGGLPFAGLLSESPTREEVVTVFLALLELLKQRRISVSQERIGAPITVNKPGKEAPVHAE